MVTFSENGFTIHVSCNDPIGKFSTLRLGLLEVIKELSGRQARDNFSIYNIDGGAEVVELSQHMLLSPDQLKAAVGIRTFAFQFPYDHMLTDYTLLSEVVNRINEDVGKEVLILKPET